jgi:hypothetical protein
MTILKILNPSLKLMTIELHYGLAKRLFQQQTYVKRRAKVTNIMKLVSGDTTENVGCVSIWYQHNKWNVSVSGSNIANGMCQYPGAT